MSEYSQAAMYEIVKKFFDGELNGDKWHYSLMGETTFRAGIGGLDSKIAAVKLFCRVKEHFVLVYTACNFIVPQEYLSKVSEFITRANYALPVGNFELDLDDGELRFKYVISYSDLLNDEKSACNNIERAIALSCGTWDCYGDNLVALVFGFSGEKTIKELIDESENNSEAA